MRVVDLQAVRVEVALVNSIYFCHGYGGHLERNCLSRWLPPGKVRSSIACFGEDMAQAFKEREGNTLSSAFV